MHRASPANSSFRAYSAGGARATVSNVDDTKLMQEMAGGMMKGESRGQIESPHSYGFSCVPFDADKDEDGNETTGAETFISFIGGNRSFPVAGPIDDRRHRLKGLEKGDVALFRGKDDGQQFHMNGIGTFLSSFPNKKLRLQLVAQAAQAASGTAQASAFAAPTAADQPAAGGQATGQGPVYKNDSSQYFEVNGDATESVNTSHSMRLPDDTAVEVQDGNVYLGGRPSKGHQFALVMTTEGPSKNVYARIP